MEPLMIVLITLIVLGTAAFISFIIVRNKRVNELKDEIKLYRQLTSKESKNNDAMVFVANLNNYSAGIIKRLSELISQSYQQFVPKWSLSYFGIFLDELQLVRDKEKKDFIKSIFTNVLISLDAKILADIITKYLKEDGNFEERNGKVGLIFITSVILKGGNAGQLATCFSRELEENIKDLLESPEIKDEDGILIQAGLIRIRKMLTA